jgi:hypothetical protein
MAGRGPNTIGTYDVLIAGQAMAPNLMGRRGRGELMTVRWSMRPSTYDRMMRGSNQRRYFENSGYFNFGYWGAGAASVRTDETVHHELERRRDLTSSRV